MLKRKVLDKIFKDIHTDTKTGKRVFDKVIAYWENEKGLSEKELSDRKRSFCKYFGHDSESRGSCDDFFKSIGEPPKNTRKDGYLYSEKSLRTWVNKIRLIHFAFHVPPKKIHSGLAKLQLKSEAIKSERLDLIANRIFDSPSNQRKRKDFVAEYSKLFIKHIINSKDYLYSYTFLGRSSLITQPKAGVNFSRGEDYYSVAHEEIYSAIEDKLKTEKYDYKRVFALPPSTRYLNISEFEFEEQIRKSSQALIALDSISLRHICYCIKHYEASDFFVAYVPYRLYHYGLIGSGNDSVILVSEYYKYKTGGDYIPNLLFIEKDRRSPYSSDLVEEYHEEFDKMTVDKKRHRRTFKLSPFLLINSLISADNYIADKMEQNPSKSELDVLMNKISRLIDKDVIISTHFPEDYNLKVEEVQKKYLTNRIRNYI